MAYISVSESCKMTHCALFRKCAILVGGAAMTVYAVQKLATYVGNKRQKRYFEKKCNEWPKDVVILHGMKRGRLTPHPSPFVLKLETFLRMHRIPYIFDSEFPKGDKLKMPWITLNKEHFTDSQLIVNCLRKKFNLPESTNYSAHEKAVGTMVRVVADEHIFWGFVLWRCVYSKGEEMKAIFNMTPREVQAFHKMTSVKYTHFSWCQGLGRHSQSEVTEIMKEDLRAISDIIGSKKFLLGDEPCDDDCAVFGMIGMFIWNDVKSPYAALIRDELPNLRDYCLRMRERFWPDWEQVIQGALEEAGS